MSAKKISGTAEGLNTVKQLFVKIAEALGKLESTVNCKNHGKMFFQTKKSSFIYGWAAGDLLLMYAHTKTFFTSNPYNTVISAPLAKEHLNIRNHRFSCPWNHSVLRLYVTEEKRSIAKGNIFKSCWRSWPPYSTTSFCHTDFAQNLSLTKSS